MCGWAGIWLGLLGIGGRRKGARAPNKVEPKEGQGQRMVVSFASAMRKVETV